MELIIPALLLLPILTLPTYEEHRTPKPVKRLSASVALHLFYLSYTSHRPLHLPAAPYYFIYRTSLYLRRRHGRYGNTKHPSSKRGGR